MFALVFAPFAIAQDAKKAEPKAARPEWIWASSNSGDGEVVYFRKTFTAEAQPKSAQLVATCDNQMVVFVNGKQVAKSNEWQQPAKVEIAPHLVAGENVIAVRGQNEGGAAGFLARLEITPKTGAKVVIGSDATWVTSATEAPNWNTLAFDATGWKKAHSLGKVGSGPWGDVIGGGTGGAIAGTPQEATPAEKLELLPGFKAERLYSVPKPEQGSWVSMCFDDKGRIIASDQNTFLYRITLAKGTEPLKVEKLDVKIGQAQGLLHTYGALYVAVNGNAAQGSGFYRVRDTNNDDQYDEVTLLKKFPGGGEHGPHGIVRGPDGLLYVILGNHVNVPEGMAKNSPVQNYAEDLLLPRQPDANGHATGRMAPGGFVLRTDKDGQHWEIFCSGFRNPYDIDFNQDGEIFTYDADMEWDTGVSWYRPTRVNHCTSAAEFGWRYGTGKWPAYNADSLGGYDIGLGSPTGVTFGTGAKFPAKYQRAFYVLDWTYGKLYAMHLTPSGSSYTATFEPFVTGKPLPLTDAAIGPDGALYFTIGGRGTQSGLYRVTYDGPESTAPAGPVVNEAAAKARALRRELEAFHTKQDPAAVAKAWPYLNSEDRALRFAARVAIERQDLAQWRDKALAETKPTALIYAAVALARAGGKDLLAPAVEALGRLKFETLTVDQQLDLLRAYGLLFIRLGPADEAVKSAVRAKLESQFPTRSEPVNRELCQVLVYLDSPVGTVKGMEQLSAALTQEEQMHYAFVLRNAKTGWTPELQRAYFSWFNLAGKKYNGGNSFKGFVNNAKKDAVALLNEADKAALKDVLEGQQTVQVVKEEAPRKYVHNWQMEDIVPLLAQTEKGRNFERGKAAYQAAQCGRCHRFQQDGGGVGHDLTGVGNRFSPHDLLESLVQPSKVVSDQYASKTVVTKDGRTVTGMAIEQPDGSLEVLQSNFQKVSVPKAQIEEIVTSKISTMPEGLLSVLTKDEVLDLIAYLRAAGKPDDKAFQK